MLEELWGGKMVWSHHRVEQIEVSEILLNAVAPKRNVCA